MAKEYRINVRTTPEIKRDFEIAAKLKGLTVSSMVNSMAVKIIREEKDRDPSAFEARKGAPVIEVDVGNKSSKKEKAA